jgi:type IX secretion system PorP/SprF family membrane protein
MKKIVGILICLAHVVFGYAQQDAQYSQYMFNHLAINPAYAGSRDVFSTALVYRNQWVNIPDAPSTAAWSAQLPLKNQKAGLGAEIFSDRLGPRSTRAFLLSYSYRIPLFTGKLAFGLKMGMMNYVYDMSKLDFKDQADIFNTGTGSSKITGTADFGLLYYSRTFYWGFSGTHLNRGRMSDAFGDSARQAQHFFMELGKSFKIGGTVLNPVLIFKSAQNSPVSSDLGLNILLKEKWWLGLSLRKDYGLVFLTQYMITEKFRIGYSYDLGGNAIGRAGGGSHEVMISYDVNLVGAKISMPRYL